MSRGQVGGSGLTFGDVYRTMQIIGEHHHVTVTLTVSLAPMGSGAADWTLLAVERPSLASPATPGEAQLRWALQVRDLGDLERTASSLYRSLIELDVLLTRARWAQLPLPEG